MVSVSSKVHQLIYTGKDVEEIIKKAYPEAVITDASDYIHAERFECDIEGITDDEFYVFALRQGFANYCLAFSLMMNDCPKGSIQKAWDIFAEARALDESEGKEVK